MVVWPVAPHALATEGSQQSWLGVKPAEPRVMFPPPEDGQLIEETKAEIK